LKDAGPDRKTEISAPHPAHSGAHIVEAQEIAENNFSPGLLQLQGAVVLPMSERPDVMSAVQ
jgi:hypothetical protein